eukprot:scaffold3767_cov242-Prasinococcus_capsulatus_cf.AAC.1
MVDVVARVAPWPAEDVTDVEVVGGNVDAHKMLIAVRGVHSDLAIDAQAPRIVKARAPSATAAVQVFGTTSDVMNPNAYSPRRGCRKITNSLNATESPSGETA